MYLFFMRRNLSTNLIRRRDKDRLFKAELCREIGRFDRCVELLDCKQFPDNMKSFADKVKQAALRKDRALFKVFEPQKK